MNDPLEYFFEGYFHQDWDLDFPTPIKGVEYFKSMESEANCLLVSQELKKLIQESELPINFIYHYGANFTPEADRMTTKEWLIAAVSILEK
ncbi:hypothetical protein L1286_23640 [Pseudoalteromonas sp. SMS1]|uniref:contact-dependent growth inhibition system immunity protein n=1 Tax=Pseudoalteromonas sp. SMS1 TaxID=2908894 RepID=UPI001F34EFE9|nr:contact-dependent growth inhibition system immunity protein [Pseudoalteromonas sp. SMS1]MCF2860460.1 hypothetical protein [Pseudoalteromonas sp. SMS1]